MLSRRALLRNAAGLAGAAAFSPLLGADASRKAPEFSVFTKHLVGLPFARVADIVAELGFADDAGGRTGRARLLARLGAEAAEVIEETLSQCLRLEREGVTDLEGALGRLETTEIEVKRELEGPRGEVRIMTVHGAKGLEAPVVILPDTTGRSGGAAPLMVPAVADDGGSAGRLALG